MATRRQTRFVHLHAAWILATLFVLAVFGAVSLDVVFIVAVVGLLVVTELTAPVAVTPTWRSRLRWLTVLAVLGFVYLVTRRILSLIPQEVLS